MKLARILPLFSVVLLLCPDVWAGENPLLTTFRYPAKQYSPVPIWWWSGDEIKKDRLAWQLQRMADGHVYNTIILNLYPNSDRPAYFSPEWWELMDFTLEKAEQLGVGIWFYDGLGFARTDVHERLMRAEPSFRAESLQVAQADVSAGQTTDLSIPEGARVVSAAASPINEDGSLGEAVNLSGQVRDGRLKWTAPEGRWRAMIFFARQADFDFSSTEASAGLIDAVHGEYERRYRRYLGNVIPGSFQDELVAMPRWSQQFLEEFEKRKGYDLTPHLPALYYDSGPRTPKYRFDCRDVMASMCEEAFFKPCFDWHRKFGMICGMDQWSRNADPVSAQSIYADYFRTMRWFDAPGQDQNGNAKAHSSIAHLYNRPRVWQEGFYNSGWGQTLEELAGLVNKWYVEGANLYDPHAWYYSTAGSWWEWAPPCTSFRQPYWRHYKYFADYTARLSFLLSQGAHVCDIAVLYPSTTVQADMTLPGEVSDVGRATNSVFWNTVRALDKDRRDYDWMDEASLQRAVCRDGRLWAASESYRVLILPQTVYLQKATARKIEEFARAGGVVVIVGAAPKWSVENGRDDPDVGEIFSKSVAESGARTVGDADRLPEVLSGVLARDFSPEIRCLHRVIGSLHVYFVLPDDRAPKKVSFAAHGRPEIWDPYTGEAHPIEEYTISANGTNPSWTSISRRPTLS